MYENAFIKLIALILHYTAPTIIGLKPATLISFSISHDHLYDIWLQQKDEIQRFFLKNLYFEELAHQSNQNITVLFYHPQKLTEVLAQEENQQFLSTFGYHPSLSLTEKIQHLQVKYNRKYPHEIGIFLGIPVADVIGFITNQGKNYLLNKYWKVYQSPELAEITFQAYDLSKLTIQKAYYYLF